LFYQVITPASSLSCCFFVWDASEPCAGRSLSFIYAPPSSWGGGLLLMPRSTSQAEVLSFLRAESNQHVLDENCQQRKVTPSNLPSTAEVTLALATTSWGVPTCVETRLSIFPRLPP
jgi:hypothetical protein